MALPGGPGTQAEIELARLYGVTVIGYGASAHPAVVHAAEIAGLRQFLLGQLSRE